MVCIETIGLILCSFETDASTTAPGIKDCEWDWNEYSSRKLIRHRFKAETERGRRVWARKRGKIEKEMKWNTICCNALRQRCHTSATFLFVRSQFFLLFFIVALTVSCESQHVALWGRCVLACVFRVFIEILYKSHRTIRKKNELCATCANKFVRCSFKFERTNAKHTSEMPKLNTRSTMCGILFWCLRRALLVRK